MLSKQECRALRDKLATVFPTNHPEEELMFGIVRQAVEDMHLPKTNNKELLEEATLDMEDAVEFLTERCWPATVQGIEQGFVTRVVREFIK